MSSALPDQPPPQPAAGAPQGGLSRGFASLRVRNYRLYWSGQVVSLIGTWMQMVSLPWLVLALGGSPLELGIVAALQFGPAMLLAPFGGVFADRVDKRRALIATQIAAMGQAGLLFVLVASGVIEIPLVMLMASVLGLINAVDMPVRQSLAADLVPRRALPNAIALNSMAFNAARVVGPAVAGVTIAAATSALGSVESGVAVNLGINTMTYLGVLIALLRMDPTQIRRHERPERHPPVLDSLVEGVRYAARSPRVLWPLILLGGVATFGFNFQILLPLFSVQVLGLNADGYGALFAAMGLGSLVGSLTLAFLRWQRPGRLMLLGGAAFGASLVAIAVTRDAWPAALLIMVAGYTSMLMINTINATVQADVPDALRGRVMSLYVTVFAGSAPLGGLFAGAVAQAWGTPAAFGAGAALSFVTLAIVAWGLRRASAEQRAMPERERRPASATRG